MPALPSRAPRPRPPARPSPRPAPKRPAKAASLAKFTNDTFAGRIGESFKALDSHGGSHVLVLRACEAAPPTHGSAPGGRRPFSLHFSGPRETLLPQGTYRFEHAALGWFPLFIVPRAQDASGTRYEAVFG
jgi:hypothetical protein